MVVAKNFGATVAQQANSARTYPIWVPKPANASRRSASVPAAEVRPLGQVLEATVEQVLAGIADRGVVHSRIPAAEQVQGIVRGSRS